MKRDHAVMQKVVEEVGRCELCGSKRGLEAHHIIPLVCGGNNEDYNLICVCQCCHARLTPRAYLTKLGRDLKFNKPAERIRKKFYDRAYEKAQGICDLFDIFDIFDEVIEEEMQT